MRESFSSKSIRPPRSYLYNYINKKMIQYEGQRTKFPWETNNLNQGLKEILRLKVQLKRHGNRIPQFSNVNNCHIHESNN